MRRRAHAGVSLTAALTVLLLPATACGRDDAAPQRPGGAGATATAPGDGADAFNQPFTDTEVYPVFVSSEIVVGENRFLMALLDERDAPAGGPDTEVHVEFFDLERSAEDPVASTDTDFIWAVEPVRGLYVAEVSFEEPGRYGAAVTVEGIDEPLKASFEVATKPETPALGEPVPPSDTPTARRRADVAAISSDPDPDMRFYRTSIAGALARKEPFVVTFATPKFCSSEVCGPTLDIVKQVAEGFPELTFIHVEVYSNLDEPDDLEVVPAVKEWRLPSEPWVFVVDGRGRAAAKYEGVVSAGELRRALRTL
ncbi:MAG: hypothetical protein ABR575_08370 [Actinomycetota bacterium]